MNIEKTISEHAVSDILTPMLDSQDRIVTEDVAPLFNDATGLDTPPASGTVTTTIEESRSVITAIIRKAWTATLTMLGGASVISSIAAAYTYLLNRLQGNETYGIPDRRSEISASSPLAANLALLNDRKIGGVPEAVDGMSMARILCDSAVAATITEIVDDNTGYTYGRQFPWSAFPNIKKAVLGFSALTNSNLQIVADYSALEELTVKVEEILIYSNKGGYGWGKVYNMEHLKRIVWIGLKRYETPDGHSSSYEGLICLCPELEEFIAEDLEYVLPLPDYTDNAMISKCGALKKVVVGTLRAVRNWAYSSGADSFINTDCPNLIHFEIGQGSACSMRMTKWNPTNALDASRTDLIEEGSTAQNNLQQFLENFRDYIAERLAKYTGAASGKPLLTLSQPVRNAIEADGIASYIKNDRNWEISPEPNNQ